MLHNDSVIEFTDWARDILQKSEQAARRFNPEARIRLARSGGSVQAEFTDRPEGRVLVKLFHLTSGKPVRANRGTVLLAKT